MDKLAMSGFAVCLAALCAWNLRRLWGWTYTDAVSMVSEHGMWAYIGQKLPVTYALADGSEVTSFLRLYGKSAVPQRGSLVPILYDPEEPTDISRASTPLVLIVAMAILALFTAALWFS